MNKISIFGEEMKEAISLSLSTMGEKKKFIFKQKESPYQKMNQAVPQS